MSHNINTVCLCGIHLVVHRRRRNVVLVTMVGVHCIRLLCVGLCSCRAHTGLLLTCVHLNIKTTRWILCFGGWFVQVEKNLCIKLYTIMIFYKQRFVVVFFINVLHCYVWIHTSHNSRQYLLNSWIFHIWLVYFSAFAAVCEITNATTLIQLCTYYQ